MSSKTLTLGATKPTRHIFCHIPNLPGIFLKTLPNLPGMEFLPHTKLTRHIFKKPTKPTRHGIFHTYQTYPARSAISRICPSTILIQSKPTRHGFIHPHQTYPARIYSPIPNLPGTDLFTHTKLTRHGFSAHIPNLPGTDFRPHSGYSSTNLCFLRLRRLCLRPLLSCTSQTYPARNRAYRRCTSGHALPLAESVQV